LKPKHNLARKIAFTFLRLENNIKAMMKVFKAFNNIIPTKLEISKLK